MRAHLRRSLRAYALIRASVPLCLCGLAFLEAGALLNGEFQQQRDAATTPADELKSAYNNKLKGAYTIAGLPHSNIFTLDTPFKNGTLIPLRFRGTIGYVIEPNGPLDPKRRWVWVSPLYVPLRQPNNPAPDDYYYESLLGHGFYVVGLDVGVSLGSPAGADLYEKYYKEVLRRRYRLNPRARMIGQSNGGLIAYAWAFRHPKQVDRIFGILPATDLRSFPGFEKVVGSKSIAPAGLAYPLTPEQLKARLAEFNPIDNLEPLVRAKVKIFHLHGDRDIVVPMEPNSEELVRRYRALAGQAELQVLKGLGHGGRQFAESERGLRFLLE